MSNPVFMLITIEDSIEHLLKASLTIFLPKFIANQFSQSPSWAAILSGMLYSRQSVYIYLFTRVRLLKFISVHSKIC